jgi:hypothetical protein
MSLPLANLFGDPFTPHLLSGPGGIIYLAVLIVVSLLLMFAGRAIIKALAFVAVGLAGAAFGATAGGLILGLPGAVIGAFIGFIVGGFIGLLLVHIGMGLALGYFGYVVLRDLTHIFILAVVLGFFLFIIGIIISSKLLELVTAILGGVILYETLVVLGVAPLFATLTAVILAMLGFYVQRTRVPPGPPRRSW